MISDQPSDEPFAFPSDFPGIVAGSAIIVPSSTLQDPPTLDLKGFQANVSASIGRTAYLGCKVKNLGHKSVSHQSKLSNRFDTYTHTCSDTPRKVSHLEHNWRKSAPGIVINNPKIIDLFSLGHNQNT